MHMEPSLCWGEIHEGQLTVLASVRSPHTSEQALGVGRNQSQGRGALECVIVAKSKKTCFEYSFFSTSS